MFQAKVLVGHSDGKDRRTFPAQIVFEVALQKSIPTQIRQLILDMSNGDGKVDGFVWELTPAKRFQKHFV